MHVGFRDSVSYNNRAAAGLRKADMDGEDVRQWHTRVGQTIARPFADNCQSIVQGRAGTVGRAGVRSRGGSGTGDRYAILSSLGILINLHPGSQNVDPVTSQEATSHAATVREAATPLPFPIGSPLMFHIL